MERRLEQVNLNVSMERRLEQVNLNVSMERRLEQVNLNVSMERRLDQINLNVSMERRLDQINLNVSMERRLEQINLNVSMERRLEQVNLNVSMERRLEQVNMNMSMTRHLEQVNLNVSMERRLEQVNLNVSLERRLEQVNLNEINSNAVFAGVGGVYEAPFPWKRWKKCAWFEAAIAVVSLNIRYLDKLVPGYRNFDQTFHTDYIGCFNFKLWRFGEWIDLVVDDHLPTLDNRLLYCQAYGNPREYWGPLVEKAYAKCKKTYEANEVGRTMDALTDLTGAVCEYFTPDINPPENLFHLLYKSCVNRSQMVCWRNDKLLTPTGFTYDLHPQEQEEIPAIQQQTVRYLHVLTAATKFPLSDGRMIEMVRLLCPFTGEPVWNGKFAEKDEISWGTVNTEFINKYKPLVNKETSEYWMTLEDFRCNFGGLVVCSSDIPYTTEGLVTDRCYRRMSEEEIKLANNKWRNIEGKQRRPSGVSYFSFHRNSHPHVERKKKHSAHAKLSLGKSASENSASNEPGLLVRENSRTVKVDNTYINKSKERSRKQSHQMKLGGGGGSKHSHKKCALMDRTNDADASKREAVLCERKYSADAGHRSIGHDACVHLSCLGPASEDTESSAGSTGSTCTLTNQDGCKETVSRPSYAAHRKGSLDYMQARSDSIASTCSAISECQSTFSTSDITLNMQSGLSRENSLRRPKSAPGTFVRNASSGSLPNMVVNNFMASSSDNFRSHGSWRYIIEYKGKWDKSESGVSSVDMKLHMRNPRIPLHVLHPDAINRVVAPGYHGKSHVIISLVQDYRHGAKTANSLLMPIGFSVYKTKNPARDEKRSLSKLSLLGEVTSYNDNREISTRFDLSPGSYFIVPYCLSDNHSGQFLVRVLAEKDPVAGKTGW
ncbi:uncharacterized protein LOC127872693 [Dreissena polymorpha]|uniref:uncharacterized protein LOC127872693 n=1 Tax=Dreissena polymorpha TaxID=45954 RepID=UPI002263C5B4|nr:uncharacterized protein LOC127872693 [Dreissena polymorpha]